MSRDRSKNRPVTAAELMAELEKDPEYVARMRQKEQQKLENVAKYASAAEPVLRELAAKGFQVNTIGELRRRKTEYGGAVPILLYWLPKVSDPDVKEDIVRTLSVPWAKPVAARPLIEEFKKAESATSRGLRWAIANALEVVVDDAVFDELVQLAREKQYAKDREMLALAIGNSKDARAVGVLIDLLDDQQLVGHAVKGLGKLAKTLGKLEVPATCRARLKELTQHPTRWIREGAKTVLASIEKGFHCRT